MILTLRHDLHFANIVAFCIAFCNTPHIVYHFENGWGFFILLSLLRISLNKRGWYRHNRPLYKKLTVFGIS